ncbi:hypothetical protein [Psychromonas algicola]|uniref:hypothetical protein n=1 Tax=Psychromonas algicola TaxID=2555642 RepID=UPI0010687D1D|nr:hypothetical protein [Psychromonas sp. RZ5]TEW47085.1 hypothetical protein E2R67_12585 [Psychromonas sp. RZ5]
MNDIAYEQFINVEAEKLIEIFVGDVDQLVQILKAHLYTENFLEKIILATLIRGDKLIEKGNFSYHHKLLICESVDALPDTLVSSLRNLNKLRNKFAHQMDMQISEADVTKVGSPLGNEYTKLKKGKEGRVGYLYSTLLVTICSKLAKIAYHIEHENA